MVKEKIIQAFAYLGKYIQNTCKFTDIIEQANINNRWFNKNFIYTALSNISYMLEEGALNDWLKNYDINNSKPKHIGLLLPGNIPGVGLHDILCTIASNNIAQIKLASSDKIIIPYLLEILVTLDKSFKNRFYYVENFANIDALIATGRTETVNYFNDCFSHIPKIIRKHMFSIGVLTGRETREDIEMLAEDILLYYGLGCRNVSKLYVPTNYFIDNKNLFLEAIKKYESICTGNTKYMNNYTYNKGLYLLGKKAFIDNGFFTIVKNKTLYLQIASLAYEEYNNIYKLENIINAQDNNLQCIATGINLANCNSKKQIYFGRCQKPEINNYADGIDTIDFLLKLNYTAN